MRKSLALCGAAVMALCAVPSMAATIVRAAANSSSGGSGAATGVSLVLGQLFQVLVAPTDLWNGGPLPRWSNADGLIAPLFATGSDDSGRPAGTQIGRVFPLWTQNGLSAPHGALVGEIGGVYQLLGSNFSGAAWGSGNLNLYYWDSNARDNAGSISAEVSLVPEPATWGLMIAGLGVVGAMVRRRNRKANQTVKYSFNG